MLNKIKAYLMPQQGRQAMISNSLKLSKSEWRQLSGVAGENDWSRHSADFRNAGLDGRTSAALHQLLRYL
jgi:hypothetical protein